MKPIYSFLFCVFLLLTFSPSSFAQLPAGFVNLRKEIPQLEVDLRYFGSNNFLGRPVRGYEKDKLFASRAAAKALVRVQRELKKEGLGIKIFDAYRPQRAVDHFQEWAKVLSDSIGKAAFYPSVDKKDLFKLGYIAAKSGHSRGSSIDLTLIHLADKSELDMGSPFDFFGEQSHHDYQEIHPLQKANRLKLKDIMEKHGFKSIVEEWWHYTLKTEPFPDSYFDFPIR